MRLLAAYTVPVSVPLPAATDDHVIIVRTLYFIINAKVPPPLVQVLSVIRESGASIFRYPPQNANDRRLNSLTVVLTLPVCFEHLMELRRSYFFRTKIIITSNIGRNSTRV